MAQYSRMSAFGSGEVNVSADDFYKVIRDWEALMDFSGDREGAPAPLIGVKLREGHSNDVLPCSRLCFFAPDSGFPDQYDEVLLIADPVARRIYYTVDGVPHVHNYLATITIAALGPKRARVTIKSMFDVAPGEDGEPIKDYMQTVYRENTIKGIEGLILARSNGERR